VTVETFGTNKVPEKKIISAVDEIFDLRPYGIIKMLDLLKPIYKPTAAYGHFGRDGFSWEKTDRAAALKAAAK
jgi:S-adenosylmethionine synthetase